MWNLDQRDVGMAGIRGILMPNADRDLIFCLPATGKRGEVLARHTGRHLHRIIAPNDYTFDPRVLREVVPEPQSIIELNLLHRSDQLNEETGSSAFKKE